MDAITKTWIRSAADERAAAGGCSFRLDAAERVRTFFAKFLRHSKGEFAAKPFELLDWEWSDIIAPLFGWMRPDGMRRFRRVSVWISKKNGKSTLCSGLVLYGLVADNEAGAEVYGAAADRQQASIIFEEVAAMVGQSPGLTGRLDVNRSIKRVTFEAKRSFYQVLSKESKRTGHGINAHVAVIDELHVVDRKLYDTLRYAGAARRQPLLIEISTAGDDKTSLGFERYNYAKQLVKGTIEDPETLAVIYEAESNEVWQDPEQWKKANPSLGVTITLDGFKGDFNEAKNGTPAAQANFKQLRLNLWQDSISSWLPVEEWDACLGDVNPEALEGRRCWGALDLASKMDLCAWVRLYELDDGEWFARFTYWAPEDADGRRQKANLTLLKPWMQSGHIIATPGNVTDYDAIEAQVLADCEADDIIDVAYDPWNATHVINHLTDAGVKCVEFRQGFKSFNPPMREVEKLIFSRKILHAGDPVTRWSMKNVAVQKDPAGNVKPNKEKSADKIDGPVGLIMCQGRAMSGETDGESVYEGKGIDAL
jgi:phage terminase large subunit-like protein